MIKQKCLEIINLDCTSSRHYCIPLRNTSILIEECMFSLDGKDRKEKEKLIIKVHKQFAHPTMRKIRGLMIDAGVWDTDCQMIIEKVYNSCEICKRYSKTPPRSVVAMPLARSFNEAVAMDLKEWKMVFRFYISLICLLDYTLAKRVPSKKNPEVIIDKVMLM